MAACITNGIFTLQAWLMTNITSDISLDFTPVTFDTIVNKIWIISLAKKFFFAVTTLDSLSSRKTQFFTTQHQFLIFSLLTFVNMTVFFLFRFPNNQRHSTTLTRTLTIIVYRRITIIPKKCWWSQKSLKTTKLMSNAAIKSFINYHLTRHLSSEIDGNVHSISIESTFNCEQMIA